MKTTLKKAEITLITVNGDLTVQGYIPQDFPQVGLHRSINNYCDSHLCWVIIHLPTGRAICRVSPTRKKALEVALHIKAATDSAKLSSLWDSTNPKEVVSKLNETIVPILKALRLKGEVV